MVVVKGLDHSFPKSHLKGSFGAFSVNVAAVEYPTLGRTALNIYLYLPDVRVMASVVQCKQRKKKRIIWFVFLMQTNMLNCFVTNSICEKIIIGQIFQIQLLIVMCQSSRSPKLAAPVIMP